MLHTLWRCYTCTCEYLCFPNQKERSFLRERYLQQLQVNLGFRISAGEKVLYQVVTLFHICVPNMCVCVSDCLHVSLQVSCENVFKHKLCCLNPLFYFDHNIKHWKYLTSFLVTCRVLKACYVEEYFLFLWFRSIQHKKT